MSAAMKHVQRVPPQWPAASTAVDRTYGVCTSTPYRPRPARCVLCAGRIVPMPQQPRIGGCVYGCGYALGRLSVRLPASFNRPGSMIPLHVVLDGGPGGCGCAALASPALCVRAFPCSIMM